MAFNIIWLTPDRFDTKSDKSTWVEMAQALINNGHKVTILTSKSKNKVGSYGYEKHLAYVGALDIPLIFRFSVLLQMLFWLKKHASVSDVIILNQDALIVVPILRLFGFNKFHLDIRTIPVEVHTIKDHLDRLLYWYLPLKLFGRTLKSYSFITERLKLEVEKEFNLTINDYVIWQSGVNTDAFYPMRPNNKSTEKFRLFYHGAISLNRGIDLVIKALSLLNKDIEIEFVIVGSGSGIKELKTLISKLSLNKRVIFEGFMPYEKMAEQISKADVCVCPLADRLEWNVSSPIKIFEYMACGKPMILTPISAHKDVANQLPFVVWTAGFTPKDFQKAILAAIDNCEKLTNFAKSAPNFVKEHYQWKNQALKLEKYLCKTMRSI